MKNSILSIASLLTVGLFAAPSPVRALTNEDVAGTYQGTSTATLPNGATITANLTATLKLGGKLKTVATVNGQTVRAKGTYQFVSEHAMLETFDTGEAIAIADLNNGVLTLNILVRTNDGQIIKEVTTVRKQ